MSKAKGKNGNEAAWKPSCLPVDHRMEGSGVGRRRDSYRHSSSLSMSPESLFCHKLYWRSLGGA